MLENGQRDMRQQEDRDGENWTRLFYKAAEPDQVIQNLTQVIGQTVTPSETIAHWVFRMEDWQNGKFQKPYHGEALPDNSHATSTRTSDQVRRNSKSNGFDETTPFSTVSNGHQGSPGRTSRKRTSLSLSGKSTSSSTSTSSSPRREDVTSKPNDTRDQATPPSRNSDVASIDSGIAGMGMNMQEKEKAQVEDFLRKRYSSSGR
jgi:hypothetical protein